MLATIPVDWHSIQTVFLDMDGTLLDLHFDNHFWLEHLPQKYANQNNISTQEASDILLQHADSRAGSLDWYCLDHWAQTFDMNIVELKHEIAHKIVIRKNVIAFLKHLRTLDKRIVLLTNAHSDSIKLKFSYVEIEDHFDEVITSHDIGLAKEQEGFWQKLGQFETFNKNHSLFIDDNEDVLNNAKRFGIKQLLTISQPDSQKPMKASQDYLSVTDYQQIIHPV